VYFEELSEDKLKVVHKPQYVDKIPKVVSGTVGEILENADETGRLEEVAETLGLKPLWDRDIKVLSGGELQLVAITAAICKDADVYLFDEPSSYLDVKQRLKAARVIRSLRSEEKIVVVVEHDLAVLDYLSDQVCIFYGRPGVYGIVSHVHSVKDGINIYLQGFLPDENVRFRREPITFQIKPPAPAWTVEDALLSWGRLSKSYGDFTLTVEPGVIHKGEVIGILGPNGIGKTTFVKLLAGIEEPDEGEKPVERLRVSYKPQYISAKYEGTVEHLLKSIVGEKFDTSWYKTEILKALSLEPLLERDVSELSGGELQLAAVAACLSAEADLYLLDEPSAYLDVEQRLAVAKAIRRMTKSREAAAFVVEHDVVAQDFIADSLMVFTGEPGLRGVATAPTTLREGMNRFLKEMGVTFRRDASTRRPRVNKEGSRLDRYQKEIGEYYYLVAED
ncbi:MAG TPA: ribosome biogenesis/translation initiation ATPase RLI, partial [Candidatus Bathyarchaeota archaeon]|nr:ribosome biogenesis/translation initiation ATPase RLI [Candidatus Bathyarchaeota archaeon]